MASFLFSDWLLSGGHYTITFAHNMGSENIVPAVWSSSDDELVYPGFFRPDANTITLKVTSDPDKRFAGHLVVNGWGASGFSGYSGVGLSGFSGYSGRSGFSGYSGTSTSGFSGYSGFGGPGLSGYSGYSGATGPAGEQGEPGPQGEQGASGYSGAGPGTGTVGVIAKWMSSSQLADSIVTDDGDVVDIAGRISVGKQAVTTTQTLTDASTIDWDLDAGPVATVTLGGNRTLANPSNQLDGGTYILVVRQDATGNRTLDFDSDYKWSGGFAPILSTAANAVDILTFFSIGGDMCGVAINNFS